MSNKTSLASRALGGGEGDITKQEICDILFVLKQIIGVILGVAVGFSGVQGLLGLVVYALAASAISYVYVLRVLQPEEDTIESLDILKEHFMMGLFAFLLLWILTFNVINY